MEFATAKLISEALPWLVSFRPRLYSRVFEREVMTANEDLNRLSRPSGTEEVSIDASRNAGRSDASPWEGQLGQGPRTPPLPAPDQLTVPSEQGDAHQESALGDSLSRRGNFTAAYAHYREAARLEPERPEHRYKLALVAMALEDPQLTEGHLREAVRVGPAFAPAHHALARFYRMTGRRTLAVRHGSIALSLQPRNPVVVAEYGTALLAAGERAAAWHLVEPELARRPVNAWVLALGARIAPYVGREPKVLAAINAALAEPNEQRGSHETQLLHYAAAALLERARDYDEAFAHARRANEAGKAARPAFAPAAFSEWVSKKIAYFTRDRLESLPHAMHGDRRPVFIVGMPRSGTSLVEQILVSHPAIEGGGELPHLGRIAGLLQAQTSVTEPYPRSLEFMSLRQIEALAFEYRLAFGAVAKSKRYVTDKMPHNFQHLELAELLLPGCHVIHCLREAKDTCVSCYFTDFERGNEYKFDLAQLAGFYRDYSRLMAHWEQALSLPILRLRYEDLVQDTEAQIRRLLEFLDLPWDKRCLRFYDNPRPVLTASEEQVRRPIYTSSIGRWKHYERHLGPLLSNLPPQDA